MQSYSFYSFPLLEIFVGVEGICFVATLIFSHFPPSIMTIIFAKESSLFSSSFRVIFVVFSSLTVAVAGCL